MLDAGADQAVGLRAQHSGQAELSLIAFPLVQGASAAWIARLAQTMRLLGARPVVVDGGRGGLLTRSFGLKLRHELDDLLRGRVDFDTAAGTTPDGIHVLRAERGIEAFVSSGAPPATLYGAFARLEHKFDAVLLAMPADELACLAPPLNVAPVIALEPGEDGTLRAYTTIKQLAERYGYSRFAMVTQGAIAARRAEAHHRIAGAARLFLKADVELAGWMPEDGHSMPTHMATLAGHLLSSAATPIELN